MLDENYIMHYSEGGTYHVDTSSAERISTAAIAAVADIADTDPFEMEPAHYDADIGILDEVTHPQGEGDVELEGSITVTIEGHQVSLLSDASLVIDPPDQ